MRNEYEGGNVTDTELEFKRLIVLANEKSLVRERYFILSLDAQPEIADSSVLLAAYL